MKKIVFIISAAFLLNSCVVSTAAKVVKGAVNVSYKAVKGTVNGISWAVSKAKER
jgi:PBP1b-binding outer membrane lipoprotein LpoB